MCPVCSRRSRHRSARLDPTRRCCGALFLGGVRIKGRGERTEVDTNLVLLVLVRLDEELLRRLWSRHYRVDVDCRGEVRTRARGALTCPSHRTVRQHLGV